MNYQRAIIVGASSGIGRGIAQRLAQSGCKVACVARRADRLESLKQEFPELIFPFVHDVTDIDAVEPLFREITDALGGLDLIVYASGVLNTGPVDEFDFSKDQPMIDVNFRSAVCWLNQAAMRFQGAGAGTIVGIGSVAGDRGRVGNPVYNASKAGFATYLEALRNRLHRHGVVVSTIKPGPVDTEMTAGLNMKGTMPLDQAVDVIVKKMQKPGEHYLKLTHRVAFAIIRLIPGSVFRKLNV